MDAALSPKVHRGALPAGEESGCRGTGLRVEEQGDAVGIPAGVGSTNWLSFFQKKAFQHFQGIF